MGPGTIFWRSTDLSRETFTKVRVTVSHTPKYVRGYYGERSVAYPLLLAAAGEVNESVKLFLVTANVQQISICHRGLQTAAVFLFFPHS